MSHHALVGGHFNGSSLLRADVTEGGHGFVDDRPCLIQGPNNCLDIVDACVVKLMAGGGTINEWVLLPLLIRLHLW